MSADTAVSASVEDRIIDVLLRDPRASFRRLASDAGTTEATARAHVHRLLADGVLDIRGHAHPLAIPNGILLVATVRFDSVDAIDLEHPAFESSVWIARSALDPVLTAEMRASSIEDLGGIVDIISGIPGVEHVHVGAAYRVHSGLVDVDIDGKASEAGHWGSVLTMKIDDLDRAILGILGRDGRASYTDIARQIGLSLQATRRRILNMTGGGALRFSTYVRPGQRPYRHALVRCTVHSKARAAFVAEISAIEGVASMAEVTAERPFLGELKTGNSEELARTVQRLRALDGVLLVDVEPILVLRDLRTWE